ncbi:MAG: DUF3971 domain-containing protein, partial [Campylobacterota bacterium]|nr:DUF3971 domain-containing protein [Campylobacterota bacterium]
MRRTLFVTHSTIRNILFAIVAIVVTLFVFLKGGISIDHLKIASFDIEGLYLKLDKKLILRVDKLVIPYTKKKRPLPNIYKDLDRVKEILHFFDYIEFKKINFKNDHYSFLFTDHIFYLTNDMFEIAAHEVNRIDDELQAVIDLVYLKKYDISLSGKLVYDYVNDLALIRGKADYRDIDAEFIIHKRKEDLYYAMKSDTFTQFKPLIDQFDIPPKISVWITDNVRAESYKLLSLKGTIKIDKKGINIVPETIIGRAELKNALVHFRDGLDPYRADKLSIYIEDGKLSFIPENSSFEGHKFQGSLSLDQLIERKAILSLDINFKERLDQEIRKIVEAYKIKVPILQKSGKTDVSLQLDVDLKSKEVEFSGDFTLGKGEVSIGDLLLPVKRGDLHIEHGVATLSGIKLYNSMVDATVDGKVYIKKRYIDLDLDIKNLHLGSDKNSFLAMKKSKLPMKIEYKNRIKISLPTLKTSISISKKNGSAVINMRDLSKIKRSLKNLPLTLDGGNLKIQTDNYKRYTFQGLLKRYDCFIYEKDSACLTQIPI